MLVHILHEGIELGSPDGEVLGIKLGYDNGTELVSLDGSNDDNLDGSRLGVSLGSTDGFILGTDEGIKLGSPDGEVLGITLGDDDVTELGSLDGVFDGKNISGLIRDARTLIGTDDEWS